MHQVRSRQTVLIGLLGLLLSTCSRIGPVERAMTDIDRLYVVTEDRILPTLARASASSEAQRSFRTVKSRRHGYYFFYSWFIGDDKERVRLDVTGTLMTTEKAARTIHRNNRFNNQERDDLAAAYGVESAYLGRGEGDFAISLLEGVRTYTIEISGATVSEERIRSALQNALESFKEENLHDLPSSIFIEQAKRPISIALQWFRPSTPG